MDVSAVNREIDRLSRQKTKLDSAIRQLSHYRDALGKAWVGEEVRYYNKTIDALTAKCRAAGSELVSLKQDISRAAEEILEEEAADV